MISAMRLTVQLETSWTSPTSTDMLPRSAQEWVQFDRLFWATSPLDTPEAAHGPATSLLLRIATAADGSDVWPPLQSLLAGWYSHLHQVRELATIAAAAANQGSSVVACVAARSALEAAGRVDEVLGPQAMSQPSPAVLEYLAHGPGRDSQQFGAAPNITERCDRLTRRMARRPLYALLCEHAHGGPADVTGEAAFALADEALEAAMAALTACVPGLESSLSSLTTADTSNDVRLLAHTPVTLTQRYIDQLALFEDHIMRPIMGLAWDGLGPLDHECVRLEPSESLLLERSSEFRGVQDLFNATLGCLNAGFIVAAGALARAMLEHGIHAHRFKAAARALAPEHGIPSQARLVQLYLSLDDTVGSDLWSRLNELVHPDVIGRSAYWMTFADAGQGDRVVKLAPQPALINDAPNSPYIQAIVLVLTRMSLISSLGEYGDPVAAQG